MNGIWYGLDMYECEALDLDCFDFDEDEVKALFEQAPEWVDAGYILIGLDRHIKLLSELFRQ